MSGVTMMHDGVWRPERDLNGRWIAARYVDHGPDLLRRYERQRDVQMVRGYEVPNYYNSQEECAPRCDELNQRAK